MSYCNKCGRDHSSAQVAAPFLRPGTAPFLRPGAAETMRLEAAREVNIGPTFNKWVNSEEIREAAPLPRILFTMVKDMIRLGNLARVKGAQEWMEGRAVAYATWVPVLAPRGTMSPLKAPPPNVTGPLEDRLRDIAYLLWFDDTSTHTSVALGSVHGNISSGTFVYLR